MRIEGAVTKAMEGGYTDSIRPDETWSHFKNRAFLEASFWQSLGKTMGWEVSGIQEEGGLVMNGWLTHWHNLIDHIAIGGTVEQYFETLK